MVDAQQSYLGISLVMRAPRVAVLFRGDLQWRQWARLALKEATSTWGGEGFAFIPYHPVTGQIDPYLIAATRAWDPDHVITMSPTVTDWARIAPESLDAGTRSAVEVNPSLGFERLEDPVARRARSMLVSVCSPLRVSHDDSLGEPALITFSPNFHSRLLMQLPEPTTPSLAASMDWSSNAALFAGARCGVAPEEPTVRAEPPEDALLEWLITGHDARTPDSLLWFPGLESGITAAGRPRLFSTGDPLLEFRSIKFLRARRTYVVGDEAEDFALAVLLDRMFGNAIWISATAAVDSDERIRKAMEWHCVLQRTQSVEIRLTSASLSAERLDEMLAHLQRDLDSHRIWLDDELQNQRRDQLSLGRPDLASGRLSLMVTDQLPVSLTVPALRDSEGTTTLQTPTVSPIPTSTLRPHTDLRLPYWLLDALIEEDAMPPGHDLHVRHLVAGDGTWGYPTVRRGRDGFTIDPSEHILVTGQPLSTRLSRVRLKVLGTRAWVRAVAEQRDMVADQSLPGRQADLLATRLGGRRALASIVADVREVLAGFAEISKSKRSDELFPDGDGVLLGREPYLTFRRMQILAKHHTSAELRARVDQLVSAAVMWPGLILRCQECSRRSFLSVSAASTHFTCPRCGAMNALTSEAWGRKPSDPTWYYDLHPIFRELMREHGDVPLLAAEKLRTAARIYDDTAETAFVDADGVITAEADVIAVADGLVHVVEAKSNGTLGRGQERAGRIRKLVDCAEFIGADRIVLATTQPRWVGRDVELVRDALRARSLQHIIVSTLIALGERKSTDDASPDSSTRTRLPRVRKPSHRLSTRLTRRRTRR